MKIFLDTNIFPEFIDRRVTTGSGHFVTVTKYPDPDVTQSQKSQSLVFPLISVDSFSPENLEISGILLIFAVES